MFFFIVVIIILLLVSLLFYQINESELSEEIMKDRTFQRVLDYIEVISQIYQNEQGDLSLSDLFVYADDKDICCRTLVTSDYIESELKILDNVKRQMYYPMQGEIIATIYNEIIGTVLKNTDKECRDKFQDLEMSVAFGRDINHDKMFDDCVFIFTPHMKVPFDINEYVYINVLYHICKDKYPHYKITKGNMARLFIKFYN